MSKVTLFILICAFCFACSSTSDSTNSNQANIPAEFSNKQIVTNGNSVPGIDPKNINVAPNPNGTPTPGIPDPRNVNVKPNPKGTPTPGIPDEKTRKQMQSNMMNANVNSRQSMTDSDKTPQANKK
ncbi:MAG TPA: hypothetical protein PKE69_01725 [Pyrinomonadaceae bacterium]|nr:hypothetical protein [Pyrinomonadaceae bacterium]